MSDSLLLLIVGSLVILTRPILRRAYQAVRCHVQTARHLETLLADLSAP